MRRCGGQPPPNRCALVSLEFESLLLARHGRVCNFLAGTESCPGGVCAACGLMFTNHKRLFFNAPLAGEAVACFARGVRVQRFALAVGRKAIRRGTAGRGGGESCNEQQPGRWPCFLVRRTCSSLPPPPPPPRSMQGMLEKRFWPCFGNTAASAALCLGVLENPWG